MKINTIGKYEVRAILGRGSMGTVYKVVIPGIQKTAAVKILAPSPKLVEKMGMDWLRDRFIREAAIIANLRHPNVVDIWSLEEEDNQVFYLMEYLCHNLGTFIGETYWADTPTRVMPVSKAIRFIVEILEGLFRLHQAGIVHRDIKPFNIMLTDAGVVKIVDFGLSKKRGETSATKVELFTGTKFYAAPEQIASPEEADHRADLYSVGIMLYRMVTGLLPRTPLKPPGDLNPDLGEAWNGLILKSVDPRPGNRFQDARSMSEAIQQVHDAYQNLKSKACAVSDALFTSLGRTGGESGRLKSPLRSRTNRILAKHAKTVFDLNDLHRPRAYFQNELQTIQNGLVTDNTTRLIWQQTGSEYPMPLQQAWEYIDKLNKAEFGGIKLWRLPSVNELLSLLNPPPPGEDFCLKSHFSSIQKWIWSGDSRSNTSSWLVNMEMGFVTSSDIMDSFYVKGVYSLDMEAESDSK